MKAVIYCRVSPRPGVETSQSIATQLAQCRAYAKSLGVEIRSEHTDVGKSGGDPDRDGLRDALDALKRKDILVAYRLDRFARDVYLSCWIDRTVKARGAVLRSASGEGTWDDTPESAMIRGFINVMGEYMRTMSALRVSAAMRRQQADGRRMGGIVPYGWMRDPDHSKLMLECPEEQEILDRIKELWQEGLKSRRICAILESEGFRARNGNVRWHHNTIERIALRLGLKD